MSTENIRLEISDSVAEIHLCNPRRHNALGSEDVRVFIEVLAQLRERRDFRALIIFNPRGNTFCAGAALDELASGTLTSNGFAVLPEVIANLPFPTIAAMNGSAYGGGAEIALACDLRIGTTDINVQIPPARIGLCYPLSGIQRFVSQLGVTTAKRLLVANEALSGDALIRLGFLTHLVDREAIHGTARALAAHMTGLAPLAMAAMKEICNAMAVPAFHRQQALALEQQCNQSRDFQEGLAAVLEKREPRFTGE